MGIKDQEAETMTGVFVPAGTPKDIVDLLQKEIATIVDAPDIKARLWSSASCPTATHRPNSRPMSKPTWRNGST